LPHLTLDPAVNNIRTRGIQMSSGSVINANKITLGNNDPAGGWVAFGTAEFDAGGAPGGTLDTAPVFELGSGGESIYFSIGLPALIS
jgi:hypothetical protein